MKKLLIALTVLTASRVIHAAGNQVALTVSSGTFQSVDMYSNANGSNRQAIVIGDRTSSATVTVDSITGLVVSIATSALTTSTAIRTDGSATTQPVSGTVSVTAGSTMTVVNPFGVSIKVDGSGATQPVSGTVSAAQSGTWTVQPGNTANTTAWKVDGSAVTQPVSGTVSVTATNTSTVTVQNAIGGSLKVDGSAVTQPVSGTFWQATQPISGTVTSNAGSGTFNIQSNASTNLAQVNGSTTKTSATAGEQLVSVEIAGSSNTVTATQSGVWSTLSSGTARTTLPAAAADGASVNALRDKYGRSVAILDCPRDLIARSTITLTTDTTERVLVSSGASGVFNDIVAVVATNTSATVATLTFRTGGGPLGGTPDFTLTVPATDTRGLTTSHIWPQAASASNITVQGSASVTDLRISVLYCQDK